MAKLFDKDGNEIEAFTPEELKTKQQEAVAEYLKTNPDKSTDLTAAQEKITALEKKLEEGNLTEGQKQRLLDDKKKAEDEKNDAVTKLTKDIEDLKGIVVGTPKKKGLEALSKGDKELREKLEAKYESLMKTGEYAQDEEGVMKALADAATLVNGSKPAPNFLDGMSGAGDRGSARSDENKTAETDNSKSMRKAMGITDKDVEQFAPKEA